MILEPNHILLKGFELLYSKTDIVYMITLPGHWITYGLSD